MNNEIGQEGYRTYGSITEEEKDYIWSLYISIGNNAIKHLSEMLKIRYHAVNKVINEKFAERERVAKKRIAEEDRVKEERKKEIDNLISAGYRKLETFGYLQEG